LATTNDPALVVVSDAAGRMRVQVEWVRSDSRRAVAVEEAVAKQDGVRAVHAHPRTGSVVVWYSRRRCDRSSVLAAISGAAHVAAEQIPARAPHSSEIRNTDVLRMVIGGAALALLVPPERARVAHLWDRAGVAAAALVPIAFAFVILHS